VAGDGRSGVAEPVGSRGRDVEEKDLAIGWTERVAAALEVPPMSGEQLEAVLKLAGDVAHGTAQRSFAPLTTFLAGLYAARCEDGTEALEVVRDLVGGVLREQAPAGGPASSAGVESERK